MPATTPTRPLRRIFGLVDFDQRVGLREDYTPRASKGAITVCSHFKLQGLSHERFHPDHTG